MLSPSTISFTRVWRFLKELYRSLDADHVPNGAAALSYYFFLALFPALISLLSILPYLPIANLHSEVMGFLASVIPAEGAKLLSGTIAEVTNQRRGGLLSAGSLLTLWAASAGMFAAMDQLNMTYGIRETRPFWKTRGISVLLTLIMAVLIIGSFALIIGGGFLQAWLASHLSLGSFGQIMFSIFRWVVIGLLLLGGFALTYYFGPDVEQKFRFISPGSVFGTIVIIMASTGFKVYVTNFGNYALTYGSIGAVIILMVWLYITGYVLLLGSEINALFDKMAGKDPRQASVQGAGWSPHHGTT